MHMIIFFDVMEMLMIRINQFIIRTIEIMIDLIDLN